MKKLNKNIENKYSNTNQNENVKVIVRCRPLNNKEILNQAKHIIDVDQSKTCLRIKNIDGKYKKFTYDTIYNENSTQLEIYKNSVQPLINEIFNGYNVTLFVYGQTGTGKTYTMEGNNKEMGIIQNTFQQIFNYKEIYSKYNKIIIECSYLEIYQRKIKDLLNPNSQEIKSNTSLQCLQTIVCKSIKDIEKYRKIGCRNRTIATTYFNNESSRSHAIFTITIKIYNLKSNRREIHSKLNLVDLAGSECLQRSGAMNIRLKECCEINLSLLALNKVIALSVNCKNYIPYRDSILTQLLQDSLGGNSKTLMIANISPADLNYKETIVTLEYANRAKKIKNAPFINFTNNIHDKKFKCKKRNENKLIKQLAKELQRNQMENQMFRKKFIQYLKYSMQLLLLDSQNEMKQNEFDERFK